MELLLPPSSNVKDLYIDYTIAKIQTLHGVASLYYQRYHTCGGVANKVPQLIQQSLTPLTDKEASTAQT